MGLKLQDIFHSLAGKQACIGNIHTHRLTPPLLGVPVLLAFSAVSLSE